ncbi:zinc transporter 1-like [Silene latifolia]|uniref:zinc transporter 1-like n=1 Tax=Silene latifolia TaxID=37657 RepID=UPI003D77199D
MVKITSSKYLIFTILIITLIHITPLLAGECTCDQEDIDSHIDKGVTIPILGKHIPALHPDKSLFFLIKSFAAGVILSTGFIHILPDAFESLSNPCLKDNPWASFPFTGLAAMVGAIGTLMIDALATSHYRKVHTSGVHGVAIDEEKFDGGHVHLATHGGPSSATAVVEHVGSNAKASNVV